MDTQKAENLMARLHSLNIMIDKKYDYLNSYLAKAQTITAQMSSNGHGSGISDKVGNNVVEYVSEMELMRELVKEQQEIIRKMEKVEGKYFDILYSLFMQDKSIADVAKHYNRSYDWVLRNKRTALQKLEEVLDECM